MWIPISQALPHRSDLPDESMFVWATDTFGRVNRYRYDYVRNNAVLFSAWQPAKLQETSMPLPFLASTKAVSGELPNPVLASPSVENVSVQWKQQEDEEDTSEVTVLYDKYGGVRGFAVATLMSSDRVKAFIDKHRAKGSWEQRSDVKAFAEKYFGKGTAE